MQVLDELALVVGVEEPRRQAEVSRLLGDAQLELGQGEAAVEGRIASPELIEIYPVHDFDSVAHS